jgi:hypothetical protein
MSLDPGECRAQASKCVRRTSLCIDVKARDALYKTAKEWLDRWGDGPHRTLRVTRPPYRAQQNRRLSGALVHGVGGGNVAMSAGFAEAMHQVSSTGFATGVETRDDLAFHVEDLGLAVDPQSPA